VPNFDRLNKVLVLEGEPDHVPFYELFADTEIMEAITGDSVPEINLTDGKVNIDAVVTYVRVTVKFYKKLGYDYVPIFIPGFLPRNNVLFADDTAERASAKRRWQDENRGIIKTVEDIDQYQWPDPNKVQESYLALYEFVKSILPDGMKIVANTPGGVLENVMWLMGAVPFFKALYSDPRLIRQLFEKVGKLISFCCGLASEGEIVGAVALGDDMGYKGGLMISPETLRKYVFPWQKRCVEEVHKHGKPFILHSCGDLKAIMDDLIDYVGIDAKHSYEDSSYPVIEYKKRYGDRIAILGGVDMDKLSRMPNKDFQAYVQKILFECAPGGGYCLGCGNSVANYVKLENYLTMLETGRKYGKYPLRIGDPL